MLQLTISLVKISAALLLAIALLLLTEAESPATKSSEGATEEYRLPWASGQRMYTLQGQSQGSHQSIYSKYAYDFALGPLNGTPFEILAVRSGAVVLAVDTFGPSQDCDPAAQIRSNFILLDHGDGTGSRYEHLAQGSIVVKVGQRVPQGAVLAKSGNTGYVCSLAHLHYTAIDTKTRESIDRTFFDPDVKRHDGRPKSGEWYYSSNIRVSSKAGVVFLPIVSRSYNISPGREAAGSIAP